MFPYLIPIFSCVLTISAAVKSSYLFVASSVNMTYCAGVYEMYNISIYRGKYAVEKLASALKEDSPYNVGSLSTHTKPSFVTHKYDMSDGCKALLSCELPVKHK